MIHQTLVHDEDPAQHLKLLCGAGCWSDPGVPSTPCDIIITKHIVFLGDLCCNDCFIALDFMDIVSQRKLFIISSESSVLKYFQIFIIKAKN